MPESLIVQIWGAAEKVTIFLQLTATIAHNQQTTQRSKSPADPGLICQLYE
jgi:hypothetical protein